MLRRERRLRLVIACVAGHSILLGIGMMLSPKWVMGLVGWAPPENLFFASQSGLFLLILGAAYMAAVKHRPLVALIVGSKAAALVFLLASASVFHPPAIVIAVGLSDGVLGGLVLWAYLACRRRSAH